MTRYVLDCPLRCGEALMLTDIVLPEGPLLRCRGCGQLISQCSTERYHETMRQFDTPHGTDPATQSIARRDMLARRRLAMISAALHRPRGDTRLLDIGCSSGAFLRVASELGYSAEGVEPAPSAAHSAQRAGLKVYIGTLEQAALESAAYDALTMFEVIEHLREPLPLLAECRRILKPGGLLMIGTGNTASWTAAAMKGRWEYFHLEILGGHVSFFCPRSMRTLASRSGFDVLEIATRNVRFAEKAGTARGLYLLGKITGELLNLPARHLGRGHDMLALLRKV